MSLSFINQHTVNREVWCEGVGLHSGLKVSVRLKPAPPNFGIKFQRVDIPGHPTIAAHCHQVTETFLATSIGSNGAAVSTIEHFMAALSGTCVDNALVEIDGPEMPIFDGSAAPYVELIEKAGLRAQKNAFRRYLRVLNPVVMSEGDSYIRAFPADHFRVRYAIDFPHPLVGKQEMSWAFSERTFGREIARARTFGFLRDVEKLKEMGLARGGSLSNAIVLDESGILNHEGFRYADECVRHKILDFMGDLALAGMPLIGHFEAYKAGHALHNRFLRQLVCRPESCAVLTPPCVPSPMFGSAPMHTIEQFAALAKAS